MALIAKFEDRPLEPRRVHGAVVCGYAATYINGERILQLETYGSPDRKMPETVSQSIQLNEAGARQLKTILERSFPGI